MKLCSKETADSGLKVYFWLWEHLCDQVLIFRRTAEILGAELQILGARLQILGAPTPE